LRKTNPRLILDYIKSSIDILINLKVNERLQEESSKSERKSNENQIKSSMDSVALGYEKELKHLENTIRNHIKVIKLIKIC
jgi:hypothetical protein